MEILPFLIQLMVLHSTKDFGPLQVYHTLLIPLHPRACCMLQEFLAQPGNIQCKLCVTKCNYF